MEPGELESLAKKMAEELAPLLDSHRAGQLILDIKDGKIVSWRVMHSGRLATPVRYPLG
jgi:hypothetical protein